MAKTLREKVEAAPGGEEFVGEIVGLSVEQLEKRLCDLAKGLEATAKAKAEDSDLADLKNEVKEASGPYNDTTKNLKLRTKFVIELIGEKGGKI